MALLGDDEGGVVPFDMTEDGEDWFQFSLDNLEMDRGCSPLRQEANLMEQEAIDFGDTDQDDDVDEIFHAGVSGPGPPDREDGASGRVSGSGNIPRPGSRGSHPGVTSTREVVMNKPAKQQQQTAARGVPIPPAKSGLEKIKSEAIEVQGAEDQSKLAAESAAAKRNSRASRSEAKIRHRTAGGMAGGVGGMPGRAETASMSSSKDRSEGRPVGSKAMSTSTAGGGGGGAPTRVNSVQNRRRLERNAREQKRSLKISQRIEDLRRMLTQFGVDVKASKSAVLSEATDYIAHLQRQQAQSEAERARLLTLLQNAKNELAARVTSVSSSGGVGGGEVINSAAALVAAASTNQTMVESPTTPDARKRTLPFNSLAAATAGATTTGSGGGGRQMAQTAGTVEGLSGCETHPAQKSWMMEEPTETTEQQSLSAQNRQRSLLVVAGPSVPGQGSAAGLIPASGVVASGLMPTAAVPVAAAAVPLRTPVPPPALASTVVAAGEGTTEVSEATARALSHVDYEGVFRTVPLPMAIANVNGNLVDCNARLTQVTGFRREEALFLSIFDLVADAFLQHTFSMISSILSLRGVANPPFFQVVGKRRDGSSAGMVRISVVQDDALRPLHFCVCVMESAAGAGGLGVGAGGTPGVAASAAPSGGFVTPMRGVGGGRDNGGCGIAAGTGVSGAGGGSEGGGRIGGGGAL